MYSHPELLTSMARQHTQELVEQASRHRLATALRRGRRQLWPDSQPTLEQTELSPLAGRLAACDGLPRVVGQAR